jgi:hypothetical protein
MENRVQGFLGSTMEQAGDAVSSQPVAAVIAVVGLGVVAGILVVGLFPNKQPQSDWSASQISKRVMDELGRLSPSSWSS